MAEWSCLSQLTFDLHLSHVLLNIESIHEVYLRLNLRSLCIVSFFILHSVIVLKCVFFPLHFLLSFETSLIIDQNSLMMIFGIEEHTVANPLTDSNDHIDRINDSFNICSSK